MLWFSSPPVPDEEWAVVSDAALGSSQVGWDLEVKKLKGGEKKPTQKKNKGMFWMLGAFGGVPVRGAGWRQVTEHICLAHPQMCCSY